MAQSVTAGGTTTTTYYVAGLEEQANSGGTSTLTKYYSVPGVLSAVSVGGTLSFLASDGLGSVSEALSSTSAAATSQQLYGPYGGLRYATGNMPTAKGYTGQYADATSSGLDYYGARSYDPLVGQFTSADSQADGLNRYGYVAGNPETATDPSGHRICDGGDGCNGGDDGGDDQCRHGCGGGGGGSGGCTSHCGTPPPPPCTSHCPSKPPKGGCRSENCGLDGCSAAIATTQCTAQLAYSKPTPDQIQAAKSAAQGAALFFQHIMTAVIVALGIVGIAMLLSGSAVLKAWFTALTAIEAVAAVLFDEFSTNAAQDVTCDSCWSPDGMRVFNAIVVGTLIAGVVGPLAVALALSAGDEDPTGTVEEVQAGLVAAGFVNWLAFTNEAKSTVDTEWSDLGYPGGP